MKHKQKLPRRRRRQTLLKSADNTETIPNPNNAKENRCNTEENSKIGTSNCKDIREKGKTVTCKMKEFRGRNSAHSEGNFHTENGSLNYMQTIKKKCQESDLNSDNTNAKSAQRAKELSNMALNGVKHNLKRHLDNPTPSLEVLKKPATFGNFRNESEDDNMPVIVNVFTLSQVPTSYIKHKTAYIISENNFSVKPPCSPPLPKLEQIIGNQNSNLCKETTRTFPPSHGITKPALNRSTMVRKVHGNIYNQDQANITNGALHVFPAAVNQQLMYQQNYTPECKTTRCYDVSTNNIIQLPHGNIKNNVMHFSKNFVPTGDFVLQQNKPFEGSLNLGGYGTSEETKPHDQCVFSAELFQHGYKNHFSKSEISNITNQERTNIEQSRLCNLSSSKDTAVLCDNLGPALGLGEHNTQIMPDNSSISPETSLTSKTSYTTPMAHHNSGSRNNGDNHFFLSPRDAKVLQLKKRLQEQEAALKKLRKNH